MTTQQQQTVSSRGSANSAAAAMETTAQPFSSSGNILLPQATSSPTEGTSGTIPFTAVNSSHHKNNTSTSSVSSASPSKGITSTSGGGASQVAAMETDNLAHKLDTPVPAPTGWSPNSVVTPPTGRKKGWPRGRKRRCLPKDAPKAPLSGYMLYMAEQRELLRQSANPPSFTELAKIVAHQWALLAIQEKQKFLDASDVEKERYQKEMAVYTKTAVYKQFMEQQRLQGQQPPTVPPPVLHSTPPAPTSTSNATNLNNNVNNNINTTSTIISPPLQSPQQENKRPRKEAQLITSPINNASKYNIPNNTVASSNGGPTKVNGCSNDEDELVDYNSTALEIPIFTDQFLRHNKAREAELRQLRKSNTDYEEQNAVLQKQIESIKLSVDKHESETGELRRKTSALNQHLSTLRADLAKAFANTPAPGWSSPPSPSTVDDYLMSLHAALTASPPATQSRTVQQAVQQLVQQLVLQ